MTGTISTSIIFSTDATGFVGYTGEVAATVAINPFITTAMGSHGSTGAVRAGVVITPSATRTALLASRIVYTTPQQTIITPASMTGIAVGQIVDIFDGYDSSNRETSVIVSVDDKTFMIKPGFKNPHPVGAVISISGMKGVVYDTTNPGIVAANLPVVVTSNIRALSLPFQPKIVATVIISALATGVNIVYTKTATIKSSVEVACQASGYQVSGAIASPVTIAANATGLFTPQNGAISAEVKVTANIRGGRTPYTGTLSKSITIMGNALAIVQTSGLMKSTIKVGMNGRGETTSINSLFAVVRIKPSINGISGYQGGSINANVNIGVIAKAQSTNPNMPFGKAVAAIRITGRLRGTATPTGGTIDAPAIVNIYPGVNSTRKPIIGRSFLAPEVPTPSDFSYGAIVSPITISSDILGAQYVDEIVGSLSYEINFVTYIRGQAIGSTGSIAAPVVISAFLRNGEYGTSVAKLNVTSVISGADAIQASKINASAHLINTPNSQHVVKAVAYAVIAPNVNVEVEDYQAVLFF